MYSISQLKKTLVLDIETTSHYENYEDFCANHPGEIKFWARKAAVCRKDFAELADKTDGEIYKQYAAVYPRHADTSHATGIPRSRHQHRDHCRNLRA